MIKWKTVCVRVFQRNQGRHLYHWPHKCIHVYTHMGEKERDSVKCVTKENFC